MTGLAELAPILRTEAVGVVRMTGYFDESDDYAQRGSDTVLSIAGVFGRFDDWKDAEDAWTHLVSKGGLPEFKMSDAEKGRAEWKGLDQDQRWEKQLPFVHLLSRNPAPSPLAIAVSIDLSALPPPTGKRPMAEAWLLAFKLVLIRMVMAQGMYGLAGERLALVFDEKDGVKGRATAMWDEMKRDPILGHLLGSLTFTDSKLTPSLQMADMLAYEGRRILAETIKLGKPRTWQWEELSGAQLPHVGGPRLYCDILEDASVGFIPVDERLAALP
jgi:hypothetical protein